jgi:NADH-quinone oxidoreductase subunit C
MTAEEIFQRLKEKFGDKILDFDGEALDPYAKVVPDAMTEIALYLRDDPDLYFDHLMCLSGVDYGPAENLGVVYHLNSLKHLHKFCLKVDVPREEPKVASVESVWRTADWHERECYDMFGIVFEGHPDLRRILCPDDWEGWPLRKDYVVEEFYHGIRVPYQEDWEKFDTFAKNPDRGHFVFKFEKNVPKNGDSASGVDAPDKASEQP